MRKKKRTIEEKRMNLRPIFICSPVAFLSAVKKKSMRDRSDGFRTYVGRPLFCVRLLSLIAFWPINPDLLGVLSYLLE